MANGNEMSVDYRIEQIAQRLEIVTAIAVALHNPQKVLALLAESVDLGAGLAALMDEFSLNEDQARAVTDIQFRRVTHEQRARVDQDVSQLRAEMRRLESQRQRPV